MKEKHIIDVKPAYWKCLGLISELNKNQTSKLQI